MTVTNFKMTILKGSRICTNWKGVIKKWVACLAINICIVDYKNKYMPRSWYPTGYLEWPARCVDELLLSMFSRRYVHLYGFRNLLIYMLCPSLFNVIRGTISSSLVKMTLQLSAACQIKLASDSNSMFISRASKKLYLFRGNSLVTTLDVPRSSFLSANPLL